jgi:hypothetical protein
VYRAFFLLPLVTLVPTVTLLAARSSAERRPHFWLRVVLLCLSIPATLAILVALAMVLHDGAAGALVLLLVLLSIAALMAVESVLFRMSDSSSGGGDDSGGRGPGPPRSAPDRPRGDLPLVESEVGRWRVRDHARPQLVKTPSRQREPERQQLPDTPSETRCPDISADLAI